MARATELLRAGIGKPAGRVSDEVERLRKKVDDLEQACGSKYDVSTTAAEGVIIHNYYGDEKIIFYSF